MRAGTLTMTQAGSISHTTMMFIRKEIKAGRLPARRVGKSMQIRVEDFHQWLAVHRAKSLSEAFKRPVSFDQALQDIIDEREGRDCRLGEAVA
jgi:excisionase family DNA binding protein